MVLVAFHVVSSNILSTKLNAGLLGGWPYEGDQSWNVNNSSKVQKTISLEVREVVFGSRLKLDVSEVSAVVSNFLRGFARIVENQNLFGGVAKDDRDLTFLAFVGFNRVKHFAIPFGVKTQDPPIIN
jgi:hypothetical protein